MFTSKSTDHLGFVSRQLANLLANEPVETALQKLTEASPPQYAQDIEKLRALLAGSTKPGSSLGPTPYDTLAKLLPVVSESKNNFFRDFVEYVQQSKVVFETYWAGVVGLIWYLGAVLLVGLGVAFIFRVYVAPSYSRMFFESGAPVPELTRAILSSGGGIWIFAIALIFIFALVIWFVVLFQRRIQRIEPLPQWPAWAPIVGKIAESYNLGLFLNFIRMLRSSGVEPQRAVAAAATTTNQPKNVSFESLASGAGDFAQLPVLTELAVATRLGHFDSEVAYQCDAHVARMSLALVEARDRLSFMLKLFLYVFVAMLVTAMYMPIFKMGSVI